MSAYEKPKFKRTQYFVAKKFQLKYVGLILMLMFATAIMCSYVVYYTSMVLLGEKLASVYPQGRLMEIIGSVNLRMLLTVLLMTPIVAIIGIYLSHKIAGPIVRMERFLDTIASGDFRTRIVLRQGDELTGLANAMNRLQDSLKKDIVGDRSALDKVIGELDGLKNLTRTRPNDTSNIIDNINRLEAELRNLIREFDKYKFPPTTAESAGKRG